MGIDRRAYLIWRFVVSICVPEVVMAAISAIGLRLLNPSTTLLGAFPIHEEVIVFYGLMAPWLVIPSLSVVGCGLDYPHSINVGGGLT